ncbi:MAG: hypothetical protein WC717_01015 [Candidatus Micrarchaeia archaeon]|jgi:hypothetical protein
MAAGKTAFASLVFISLMLPAAFCAWSQALDVFVADSNGLPVQGASIRITYQKASGTAGNDGLVEGKTGEDGKYYAGLENTVPEGLEDRAISVEARAYGWLEEKQALADGSGQAAVVAFAAPFELSKATITVLQASGLPAIGASVYISGSEVKLATDYMGKAAVYAPSGLELSGFVSYGGEGEYFSAAAGSGREITVTLPAGGDAGSGGTVLSVTFIAPDKSALAGEKAVFTFEGRNVSAYTDAGGVASVEIRESGPVLASVRKNDHDYEFSFNVTGRQPEKRNRGACPAPQDRLFRVKPRGKRVLPARGKGERPEGEQADNGSDDAGEQRQRACGRDKGVGGRKRGLCRKGVRQGGRAGEGGGVKRL